MADSYYELIGGGQRKECPLDEKGLTAHPPPHSNAALHKHLDTNPKLLSNGRIILLLTLQGVEVPILTNEPGWDSDPGATKKMRSFGSKLRFRFDLDPLGQEPDTTQILQASIRIRPGSCRLPSGFDPNPRYMDWDPTRIR